MVVFTHMKVISVLKKVLSVLFPPRADETIVDTLTVDAFRSLLLPKSKRGVTTLLPYSNSTVRSVLWEAKFHRNEKAISLLAHVLADYLQNEKGHWLLVPIPVAPKRLQTRGYNQCELIAHEAVSILNYGEVLPALKKNKETATQTSLPRDQRLRNVEGAFEMHYDNKLRDAKIFVLDDVTTTGATLDEARRAFMAHGVSVTCIALTRAG